jgi:hypothetical protein
MPYNVNYKTDIENTEGQVVTINIEDRKSGSVFPYQLQFSSVKNTNGTYTFTFTFSGLPADATGTLIGYSPDNIVAYTFNAGGVISPRQITLPLSFYYFKFVVLRPGGDETYELFGVVGQTNLLKAGADPIHLQVNNNTEDKMNPIAGLQMVMQFDAQDNSLLNTLLRGSYSDKRYFMTADINGRFIFKGFLNLPDTSEPFMPRPVITFNATDGLGSLKNKKLKDFTGANPTGMHTLAEFIAWCLKVTGVEENFNVIFNSREGTGVTPISYANFSNASSTIFFPIQHYDTFFTGQRLLCTSAGANNGQVFNVVVNNAGFNLQVTPAPIHESGIVNFTLSDLNDGHFFQKAFLDAKFAEDEVGTSISCYEVLENILKKLGTLGQRHGEWWFKNFDEYGFQPDYVSVFNKNGIFVEALAAANYIKEIGNTAGIRKNMKWSQHSANVGFTSPAKMARLLQHFVNPKELPCNLKFERGTFIADLDSVTKKFSVECWQLLAYEPLLVPSTTSTAFIIKKFLLGYENERYVVIDKTTTPPHQQLLCSEFIRVNAKDKFDISVDTKHDGQIETGSFAVTLAYMQVQLFADDGTFWTLYGGGLISILAPEWQQCTAAFNTNQRYFYENFNASDDDTQWRTCTFINGSCPAVPRTGKIRICLTGQYKVNQFQYIFSPINFDLLPFINGTNSKYTGQHHKVEIVDDENEKVDDEVFIDNLPNQNLKGALQKYNGTTYIPCGLFWNSAVFPGFPPDFIHQHPFGHIRIFAVWNQIRLLKRIIKGSINHCESDSVDARDKSDLPTIFHTYYLRDTDEHINDKQFMLINYDLDLYRCQFLSAAFKEVFNLVVPNDYDVNNYEFKFLTN